MLELKNETNVGKKRKIAHQEDRGRGRGGGGGGRGVL